MMTCRRRVIPLPPGLFLLFVQCRVYLKGLFPGLQHLYRCPLEHLPGGRPGSPWGLRGVPQCATAWSCLASPISQQQLSGTSASAGQHEHCTAQHSTARHGTARHSTAQHSTAQHSTAQHSTAQHSTAHLHSGVHSRVNDLNTMRREVQILQEACGGLSSCKAGVNHHTSQVVLVAGHAHHLRIQDSCVMPFPTLLRV